MSGEESDVLPTHASRTNSSSHRAVSFTSVVLLKDWKHLLARIGGNTMAVPHKAGCQSIIRLDAFHLRLS